MLKLPSINRRSLLSGLAAASVAATSTVAIGVGTDAVEEPDLIALGDALPAAEAEMVDAERSYLAIYREWQPHWPLAPGAIACAGTGCGGNIETGLDGGAILANGTRPKLPKAGEPWGERPRTVYTAAELRNWIGMADRNLARRRPRHPLTADRVTELLVDRADLASKLALAEQYEAEKARVLAESGFKAAVQRQAKARDALSDLVGQIMTMEPRTMVGVIIQAQALTSWGKNPLHAFHVEGMRWPQQLAASLLRIAAEARGKQA